MNVDVERVAEAWQVTKHLGNVKDATTGRFVELKLART